MRDFRRDSSSAGFGKPQVQALTAVGVLVAAWVGGTVDARGRFAGSLAADGSPRVVVASGIAPGADALAVETSLPVRRLPRLLAVEPMEARLAPERLDAAEVAIRSEIHRGAFPGAALAIGRGSRLALLSGIGQVSWGGAVVEPERTVYDLASLTKVVATTTAAMLLVEDGRLELDAPVSRYLPEFSGGAKEGVTVRHLLTHTSGLPAWADLWARSPDAALREAIRTPLRRAPGARAEYSDVGFVVLFAAAEAAAGEPLPELLRRRVFDPLGMLATRFTPGEGCAECAPTLRRKDGRDVRGAVHDPIARHLDGVAGNAGLFSTVEDLSRFAAMLAGGGELDGVRVLREATVGEFTRRQPGAGTRALGWDTPEGDGTGAAGERISPRAFGHTGYTGTSLWIDPDRNTWTVLLTNRTYAPKASNRIQSLRRRIHDRVAAAADLAEGKFGD